MSNDATEILTDDKGIPIVKPSIEDFSSVEEYARAFYAYKDRVAAVANAGFNAQWAKSMRGQK